jgi:glucose/mannose-6-phosphate isomerase
VRLKNQLNENAKAPAFFSAYPELCHNELAGWGQLGDLTRQLFFLVEFRSGWDPPDQRVRSAFLREALGEVLAGQACLECRAPNPLAEFFGLSVMADALSLEVARRLEIDPGPVPVLEELKARLEKAGASSGPPPF